MDEPLVEYAGSGTANRTFLHADARGLLRAKRSPRSVSLILRSIAHTDSSGALIRTLTYDEYGNPGPTNFGRYQYTGQTWLGPAVGLYHYKNRAYHPGLMRFMQADPIGHTGGINLYAYVGGDSVNMVDPLGLSPLSPNSPDPDGQPDTADGCPFSMYCNDREFAVWRISIEAAQFYNQSLGFDIKVAVAMTGRIVDCNEAGMAIGNFLRSYGAQQQRAGGLVAVGGGSVALAGALSPFDGPIIDLGGGAIAISGGAMMTIGTLADIVGQFIQGWAVNDGHHAMSGIIRESNQIAMESVITSIVDSGGTFASRVSIATGAVLSLTDSKHRMMSCDS